MATFSHLLTLLVALSLTSNDASGAFLLPTLPQLKPATLVSKTDRHTAKLKIFQSNISAKPRSPSRWRPQARCSLQSNIFAGVVDNAIVLPFRWSSLSCITWLGTAAAILAAVALNWRRILWPGSSPDPAFTEPLPEGSLGCPWIGVMGVFGGRKKKKQEIDFNQPRIWKLYALLMPFVIVSGSKRIKDILKKEFQDPGYRMATMFPNERKLLGSKSLFLSGDRDEHSFLRRLIGQAMTPASISEAMPRLQTIASDHVNDMMKFPEGKTVVMEEACRKFTLDVAGRQILGMDLVSGTKANLFGSALDEWLQGLISLSSMLSPFVGLTRAMRARRYLESEIRKEIKTLRRNGPQEGSTISAMVYATDDDAEGKKKSSRKLTDEQIVDNVLFLILAGSETSASTLTNAVLLLGLHPSAWKAVVLEQRTLVERHGEALSASQLDNDCPFLDAVVKETMRIKSISGGQYRSPTGTMVVDGKQIPKGWAVGYSIRRTHQLDPMTREDDGSHMDIHQGFVPERWLDEKTRPDAEFMPFGTGPRYCLGSPLAMAEMKTFLATMARCVDFDLVSEYNGIIDWKKSELIPIPKDGVVTSVRPAACVCSG